MRGTCSPGFVLGARCRPGAGAARHRSDAFPRSRWCRLLTSSGRTSGSASQPTPSTGLAVTCGRSRSSAPTAAASSRTASLSPDERPLAAARRGRVGTRASSSSCRTETESSWSTMASALRFNNLKLTASEQAPRLCQEAMGICGIAGYMNGHAVQHRAPPARLAVGVAHGRERTHPRHERQSAADRQGRLLVQQAGATDVDRRVALAAISSPKVS